MNADQMLTTASRLVTSDRNTTHGDAEVNFGKAAEMWNAYLRTRRDVSKPLTASDVGAMMAIFKIVRMQCGTFNEDDYVDAAAYLALAGQIESDSPGAVDG